MEAGDILLCLPGAEDIESACAMIRKEVKDLVVIPMYAALPEEDQARIFQQYPGRKCIVSTNIAETSLTISGITYVIDVGLTKQQLYNARLRMDRLQTGPASQASGAQKAGRAGRTHPGVCFRLYTFEAFREAPRSTKPAIRTDNIGNLILRAAMTGPLLYRGPDQPEPSSPSFNREDPTSSEYGPDSSEGFIHHVERPRHVGLGWGSYDMFYNWQSRGLQVKPEMVPNVTWKKAITGPLVFSSKDDEIQVSTKLEHVELLDQGPRPILEALKSRKERREDYGRGRDRGSGGRSANRSGRWER
ncbi:P-loop containing nucleoside triphosphate hydrolase protein [Hypoxylon cercidicola]|nr:P-loop containing nucleoside triphosphate hydrolase protein [Hypoxylon cercidicola]